MRNEREERSEEIVREERCRARDKKRTSRDREARECEIEIEGKRPLQNCAIEEEYLPLWCFLQNYLRRLILLANSRFCLFLLLLLLRFLLLLVRILVARCYDEIDERTDAQEEHAHDGQHSINNIPHRETRRLVEIPLQFVEETHEGGGIL